MDRNEAIDIVKKNWSYDKHQLYKALETLIPELKENEDDRIRKELLQIANESEDSFYMVMTPDKRKRLITWLEKQDEQKYLYKIESKFKTGDWIVFNGQTLYIREVVQGFYRTVSKDGIYNSYDWDIDNVARLWTIQDAKEGDVLIDRCDDYKNPLIFILKKFEIVDFGLAKESDYSSYCFLSMSDIPRFKEGHFHHKHDIKPATKEQRDILFQKMNETGYEWNAEKKELRKIEQKSTWSEEDEANLNNIIWLCNNCIKCIETTWIPSQATKIKHLIETIKEKGLAQQTSAWSEEDEMMLEGAINKISDLGTGEMVKDWLKSLKDRLTWKPSKEQIMALRWVLNNVPYNKHKEEISGLLDQIIEL